MNTNQEIAITIPNGAGEIIRRLERDGYQAYVVGGCVRDALLGKQPNDWDICTSAKPHEMQAAFSGWKVIETGLQHGTLTVLMEDGSYEITTFRVDGGYSDFRHPDSVSFTDDVALDLSRRDFTVNAMAYAHEIGLMDPFDGRLDLALKRIRCVGDPSCRFGEDALRILRALRFASALGFEIDLETGREIHNRRAALCHVSPERIASELKKLLAGRNAARVLSDFPDVICAVIPELEPLIGFAQHSPYHDKDVWGHTVEAIASSQPNVLVRLALLLHDIGKPGCFTMDDNGRGHFYGHELAGEEIARAVMRRLKMDNATIDTVSTLIRFHQQEIEPNHRSVRRLLSRIGEQNARLLLEVRRADHHAHAEGCPGQARELEAIMDEIIAQRQCFKLADMNIKGNELLSLGVPPGKEVGDLLRRLFEDVLQGTVQNDHEELVKLAKRLIASRDGGQRPLKGR